MKVKRVSKGCRNKSKGWPSSRSVTESKARPYHTIPWTIAIRGTKSISAVSKRHASQLQPARAYYFYLDEWRALHGSYSRPRGSEPRALLTLATAHIFISIISSVADS